MSMYQIASFLIFVSHTGLFVKRLAKHLLVYLVNSPFRWRTEHRKIKYEFSYRRYS